MKRFLFLADRRVDQIISGGANVVPAEVEAILASRPEEFHPRALLGRVEDWRVGLGRRLCSPLPRPFGCEVSQHLDRATFPVPATSVGSRTGAPV
jgi:acyl-CoA synthetase (AMP-forming)/AMP-acid ligase II